jgi:hypothetical protein
MELVYSPVTLDCKLNHAVSPDVNFLAWHSHFWHLTVTGASKIFLFSQVMKHIEEAVAELKSVIL